VLNQGAEKETPHPDQLGGETGKRGGAADLAARAGRYGTAKSHTLRLVSAMGAPKCLELGIRFGRVSECGSWLKFRDYYTGPGIKLHSANFCKNTLVCSLCAIRRASRNLAAYLERFQVVQANRPTLKPYLVTLTVRNGSDLGERLAHLSKSLRLLHHRRMEKKSKSLMRDIAGGVFSIEVTNTGNEWHPHVHAIWLAAEYPNQHALRAEWEQITGDSFMCDVREISPLEDAPADIDPHAKGFAEVFKYAMKPSELGPALMIEAYPELKGKRLLGSFGDFRGVPESKELADDLAGLQDLPYEEFLFHYINGRYRIENSAS
jgi:Replication protein